MATTFHTIVGAVDVALHVDHDLTIGTPCFSVIADGSVVASIYVPATRTNLAAAVKAFNDAIAGVKLEAAE